MCLLALLKVRALLAAAVDCWGRCYGIGYLVILVLVSLTLEYNLAIAISPNLE